jgi:hypothetical protein
MGPLGLICFFTLSICSASAAEFFPLAEGNNWTYQGAVTVATFTMSVGAPTIINGLMYYPLQGYVRRSTLVRLDGQKNLTQVDPDTGSEQTLTVFSTASDWTAPARICPQQGTTLADRGRHDGPAGPLADVLQIRYRITVCADVGDLFEQYAENIGMVQRVSDSIAGPQTFNLTHATVGNIEIDAVPNARFAVSFRAAGRSGAATAVLRLRNNSSLPLHLKFATGQEYDVAVVDAQGQTVWTWSDGQFFTQDLHEETIARDWTVSVTLPQLILDQPGNYNINAWITTSGPHPSFAAMVPITTSPAP